MYQYFVLNQALLYGYIKVLIIYLPVNEHLGCNYISLYSYSVKIQKYIYIYKHTHIYIYIYQLGFPVGASGKEPSAHAGDTRDVGLTPGSGRSPGGEHGNPLQYSCLENSMDRGSSRATVHRLTKSWT